MSFDLSSSAHARQCLTNMANFKRAEGLRQSAYNVTSPTGKRKSTNPSIAINGLDSPPPTPGLVDTSQSSANSTHERTKSSLQNAARSVDGLDLVSVASPTSIKPKAAGKDGSSLSILQHVRSIRDQAREEFGKVYKVLAPHYNDVIFIRATYELHGVQILLFARATSADADVAQIFCPD